MYRIVSDFDLLKYKTSGSWSCVPRFGEVGISTNIRINNNREKREAPNFLEKNKRTAFQKGHVRERRRTLFQRRQERIEFAKVKAELEEKEVIRKKEELIRQMKERQRIVRIRRWLTTTMVSGLIQRIWRTTRTQRTLALMSQVGNTNHMLKEKYLKQWIHIAITQNRLKCCAVINRNFLMKRINLRIRRRHQSIDVIKSFISTDSAVKSFKRYIGHYRKRTSCLQRWWRSMVVIRSCQLNILWKRWAHVEKELRVEFFSHVATNRKPTMNADALDHVPPQSEWSQAYFSIGLDDHLRATDSNTGKTAIEMKPTKIFYSESHDDANMAYIYLGRHGSHQQLRLFSISAHEMSVWRDKLTAVCARVSIINSIWIFGCQLIKLRTELY